MTGSTLPPDEPVRDVPLAHSLDDRPLAEWESLPEHLLRVATRAATFASRFGAEEAAWLAGILHDIGKISAAFQARIRNPDKTPKCNHAFAGAVEVEKLFAPGPMRAYARLIAFCIAGHHAGLFDGAKLERVLAETPLPAYDGWQVHVPSLPEEIASRLPGRSCRGVAYHLHFLGRMIFSCLVDADFLETDAFYRESEGRKPDRGPFQPLPVLKERLDRYLARFDGKPGDLNAHRTAILAAARAKAALPPGLFTMTVPTGGGKTLASLAFALDHAVRHGLDRVIYCIPYTSIVEQTAGVFRDALGDEQGRAPDVLEHHGSFDWSGGDSDSDDPGAADVLAKLRRATENWDVPVVVTTAVQFFESLHANRTGPCRKLHNLARSVVVLDEAQTLPTALLRPCIAAIDELAACYGSSVVLCTATQPAVRAPKFKGGLVIAPEREIAPDPEGLYKALKRVTVEQMGDVSDADIAARFAEQDRMLCIVNSRRHAQALFALIRDLPGARHLTTLMCPAHRRRVLAEARVALTAGEPVRLVSTSLIEAGVDVDFPEVWRAQTGLDSIAQAAGRANREGGPVMGRVVVFESTDHPSPRQFRHQIDAMKTALRHHGEDPLGLAAIDAYFTELYWQKAERLDAGTIEGTSYPILPAIEASFVQKGYVVRTPYESIAQAFRMIDDAGQSVIVPWRGTDDPRAVDKLLEKLRAAPVPPGDVLRRLQQFAVSVPRHQFTALRDAQLVVAIEPARYPDRFWAAADTSLLPEEERLYRETTGLTLDRFGTDPMAITI